MSDTLTEFSLLAANERFYRTLEALDYEAMAALWEDSVRVFCVHPGWPPLRGARPVLASWRTIMENTQEIRFTLTGAQAHITGGEGLEGGGAALGTVTVHEHIYNSVDHQRQASGAVSTNLFSFDAAAGLWRIFHHHASHSPVQEEDEGGLLA